MDETEKYKQRLEAIAEKRRLQEDQDRARRDMEDEKLRLQQLKRKSLRDQWLMEGAPLSPTSQEAQRPRSPLWGSQAQEMEKHIDKLQSESQRLAEEEDMLKEQMGDGQTEAGNKAEAEAEMVQDAVVQNGENNGLDEVKTKSTPPDETAAVLTNGEADTDLDTRASTNGPVEACGTSGGMESEPWLSLGVSEAEPAQVPHVNFNEEEEEEEEEEEGTLVMRAERVIITDEGDDVPEELTHLQETTQTEEAGQEEGGAAEGEAKTEAAPGTFAQPEKSEATEPTAEEQSATGDGDSQGGAKTSESGDGERKSEGRDEDLEGPTSVQVHPQATTLEGTAVASVPVYSEVQPFTLAPEVEAEGEAALSPEGAEAALKVQGPAALPGQSQEVPLADLQERSQRTEARPGEREPLLSQAKANDAQAKPAAAAAASTGTHSSARAGQGGEAKAPEHKICQCCSFM